MVFLFGKGLVLKKYIKKRLIDLIPILIGISFLSFLLMYLSPNDPAQLMLSANGQAYTKEQLNIVRENLGLNEPFLKQYFSWALGCLHGDFGTSYITGKPVSETLLNALWPTIQLSITSLIFTLVISIPLGILSAVKKNKVADYIIRIFSFIGSAVPGFLLALILIYVFSIKLGVLPAYGNNKQYSIVMPTITLGLGMTCKYIRQVRASILEELNKPYVLGARSRGVKESTVIYLNVPKKFNAYNFNINRSIFWLTFGRNLYSRDYIYVARTWKAIYRCYFKKRLFAYSRIYSLDCSGICNYKFNDRFSLQIYRPENKIG